MRLKDKIAVRLLLFLFTLLTLFGYSAVNQAQTPSIVSGAFNTMALIAEGQFVMGSNTGPEDEKPEHRVFVK